MASTSDIRNGLTIKYNNDLYSVVEFLHVKPGKGPAFVRTKLKSITTGKVIDNTFSAGHKIETVRVERRKYQYLYKDDTGYIFMNTEDYSQIPIEAHLIERPEFLLDGSFVEVLFHAEEEMPISVELPQFVEMEISWTEPGLKGDTATNANKPAKVATGAEIRVPLFINEGDLIKIDTAKGAYVERVKQ